jgi:hypothetical protein
MANDIDSQHYQCQKKIQIQRRGAIITRKSHQQQSQNTYQGLQSTCGLHVSLNIKISS